MLSGALPTIDAAFRAVAARGDIALTLGRGARRALRLDDPAVVLPGSVAELCEWAHPEDRDFLAHTLGWARAAGGKAARIWCRLARPDEGWVPVLLRSRIDKGVLQVEVELDDVASARRAEAQIRQVVEEARQAAVVDVGDNVAYTNHALARMLGYASLAELREGGQKDHVHPDDREMVRACSPAAPPRGAAAR